MSDEGQILCEEPLPDIRTKSKAATNVPSTSRKQEKGLHYEIPPKTKRIEPSNREDIVGPKKKVPPKSLVEQIFTPVFMCQLVIIIICVFVVNSWSASVFTNQVHTTIENGRKKLDSMDIELETLKTAVSDTKHLYEEYKGKKPDDIRSKLDVIQPNMFNKDSFIMAFMILIVMVFVLAISVYNLYQRSNDTIPERTGGRTTARHQKVLNYLGSREVLQHIPKSPDLEPGVCIISFDESRIETHKRILDTANIPNCMVKVHVVRRHEHIPNLPRCKVYLMCTEFNERHVIIEEPDKGLGDLHRTTYDAVLKLGGCLIILYTRDPESRNLKDQCRYNPKIYCVANQQELSVLNQDGRFFSVYDKLTQYQKSELRKQISENMT